MGRRVLIAEDEAHIVESLTFILSREGYEVTSAGDGDTALAAVRGKLPPDLMILDVMLPRRNGFEVLRAVRADQRTCGLPVLMLTAKAQPHDRALAEEIGVQAYVTKPFSNRDVIEEVRRLTAH